MPRLFWIRLLAVFAVLSAFGASAPALACGARESGVGVQLGRVFFGFSKRAPLCPPPLVQSAVSYYTQPPPPPPVYVAPPVVYAPPPLVVAAPPVVQAKVAQARDDRPGFLAVKYMPGVSSNVSLSSESLDFGSPTFAHSPGLELRLTRWFSLRSDLEFRRDGRTWDMLGLKLSLFPSSSVKPYASVSFSGSEHRLNPGKYLLGVAGAAGLDVFLGKYFFLEAEARYRVAPGACCSEVPTVSGLIGGGVAFF